jgi:hypothetical protein
MKLLYLKEIKTKNAGSKNNNIIFCRIISIQIYEDIIVIII